MTIETATTSALRLPLLVACLLAGAAQAQAQTRGLPEPGMLPDHPMYFLTIASEGIGTLFTFGDASESKRALELSEKRLAEARALADQGKTGATGRALERYRAQLDRALTEAEEARANGKNVDEILSRVSEATSTHQTVLSKVYDRVPEQARPGIERAMEASERGHERAQKARAAPSGGRPDSPGRGAPRGRGPSDSMESERPDDVDRDRPRARDRGRPDSVEGGRPDTTGGRTHPILRRNH